MAAGNDGSVEVHQTGTIPTSHMVTPRLAVVCGRNAPAVKEAAARLGWDEWATDWRAVSAGDG